MTRDSAIYPKTTVTLPTVLKVLSGLDSDIQRLRERVRDWGEGIYKCTDGQPGVFKGECRTAFWFPPPSPRM